MADIESILNGEAVDEPQIEAEAQPEMFEPEAEAEAPEVDGDGQPRDERGRFAPKGENEGGSPPPANVEPPLEHSAIIGERRRRQEAERQLGELQERLNKLEAGPPPNVWDDEQGFAEHIAAQAAAQAEAGAIARMEIRQVERSADAARSRYPDFDAKIAAFVEKAGANPALEREMITAADPGEFAYRRGEEILLLAEHGGSVSAMLKAERAKWEAEKQPASVPAQSPIPSTLADAQSSRTSAEAPAGPPSLEAILKG